MKKRNLLFLPFSLLLAGAVMSCEEVQEPSEYDNWADRNRAYVDSIRVETGENYVIDAKDADAMELGKLYAIRTKSSTSVNTQYVYCKKLIANQENPRPIYVGEHAKVLCHYYGTLVNGFNFDKTFVGYSALDREITYPLDKVVQPNNEPATFNVAGLVAGFTEALQYMRVGERWMLYIPYQSGYGLLQQTNIPTYSTLVFDVILEDLVK